MSAGGVFEAGEIFLPLAAIPPIIGRRSRTKTFFAGLGEIGRGDQSRCGRRR